MRILLDATGVRSGSGGMATCLRGLLEGWSRAAPDDELFVVGTRALPPDSARLVPPDWLRLEGRGGPAARVRTQQWSIPRSASRLGADVILSADPSTPFRAPVPVVAIVHDLRHLARPEELARSRRWYRGLVWRHGIERATRLIANSDATRRHVEAAYPRAAGRVSTVYWGADHARAWAARRRGDHAVAFAHWTNKRPELAIRTWAELARRGCGKGALHVVGAPARDRRRLGDLAFRLGVGDRVVLQPFLDDDRYRELFASAALLVMPSTHEGFGLPLLEAMTLGIPVVATAGAGMEEAGGPAAAYVDSATPEAFADACEPLLLDPEQRQRAVEAGLAHAARFTWEMSASRCREVLADACGERQAG